MPRLTLPRLGLLAALVAASQAVHAVDLLEAYRLARDNDRQWRIARAKLDEDREYYPQARAQLLPVVNATASKLNVNQTLSTAGIAAPEQRYPSTSRSLTVRQPLMVARQLAGVSQALAKERQGEYEYLGEEQQLGVRVTGAYLEWLLALDRRATLEAQRSFVTARLQAATLALRAGQGTRTDIDDATAELDRLKAQAIQFDQAISLARRKLENIIGKEAGEPAALVVDRVTPEAFPLKALPEVLEAAQASNPIVLAAREEVVAARAALQAATRSHLPTLDLVAQYSNSTGENSYFASTANRSTSVGMQMTLPIFSGGAVTSQQRQALARLTQAEEQLELQSNNTRVQVQTEYQAVRQGLALVEALRTAVGSSEQAVLSNQKGFQAGTRSTLDVLRSESQRAQTLLELSEARYQLVAAWARLQGQLGTLNEADFERIATLFKGKPATQAVVTR